MLSDVSKQTKKVEHPNTMPSRPFLPAKEYLPA